MSPGSDADIARMFMRSFNRAVAEPSERAMIALRQDTIILAAAIRATTPQPERAVMVLKTILRTHISAGWAPSIAAAREAGATQPESLVYAKLFEWWVSAYYEEPAQDPPPLPAREHATA